MTDHRARYGPHNPDETYVAHGFPEQLVDLGEVRDELREGRRLDVAGAAAHPRADRVVVGLRGGDAAARRALRGRSPSISGARAAARARRAATRSTTWATTSSASSTSVIGRPTIVSGLSSGGVLSAWLSAYAKPGQVVAALLRGSAAVRVGGATGHRARDPPVPSARCSTCGAPTSATSGRSGRGTRCAKPRPDRLPEWMRGVPDRRRAAAEPQGVRPRVGPCLLDRDRRGVVRPRADAAQREGPVLLTHHMRIVDEATGMLFGAMSDQQAATGAGAARRGRRAGRVPLVPDVGHSMHGDEPDLYVDTLLDWVAASTS